jgi:hypothetical protein
VTIFNFVLYLLAVAMCVVCTALLFQTYARNGLRLLLWTALCFVFLTLNNVLLFVDLAVFDQPDLRAWRIGAGLLGLAVLFYGFAREPG